MARPQPQQVRVIPQPRFVEDEITPQPQAVSRVSALPQAYAKARKRKVSEELPRSSDFQRPTQARVIAKATRHQAVGRVSQRYGFERAPQPLASEQAPQLPAHRKVRQHVVLGRAAQPLDFLPFGAPPPQFGGAPAHLQALKRRSPQPQATKRITRALILSLSVCYHARLQDRARYEEGVSRQFVNPLSLPGGDKQFRDEIRWLVLLLIASKCFMLILFLVLGARRFSWIT